MSSDSVEPNHMDNEPFLSLSLESFTNGAIRTDAIDTLERLTRARFDADRIIELLFLRPGERFLAQLISVSTEPGAFVRERIRLGDTTNFLRAADFSFRIPTERLCGR